MTVLMTCVLLLALAGASVFEDEDSLLTKDRFGDPPATAALASAFRALPPMNPPRWMPLQAEWTYAVGDPREGLNTTLDSLPARREKIALPHRVLHIDTPLWYVAEAEINAPSVLEIRADDGAQLYVNGARIRGKGNHFTLENAPGRARLVVRVLNKAMYGGLNSIRLLTKREYEAYHATLQKRLRLKALVDKVRRMQQPKGEDVAAVLRAVETGDHAAIETAEKRLATYPLTLLGPYLQEAGPEAMTVVWETDVPCAASVEWGEGVNLSRKTVARSEGTLHVAKLTGLTPGAAYGYRVRSGDVVSKRYRFRALPKEGPFEFTAWADVQGALDAFRQNVNAMRRLPSAFTVGVGDLVEDAHRKEVWVEFLQVLTPLASETPVKLVPGNHDYDGCFEDLRSPYLEQYIRSQPKPQYSAWTVGNARFVALDPNEFYPTAIPPGSEQREWFECELESPEWKRATWRFVFIHQPPYGQGWEGYHGDVPIREMLEPLLEKYGIDFIVAGHNHNYERWIRSYGRQKAHFLIVGGAGAGLEDEPMSDTPVMDKVIRRHHFGRFLVDGNRVLFEAIATDTRVLDRFEVRK